MAAEPLARFHDVTRSYGARKALDALSLEVRAGEVLGLVGPNGAGKTTALRILCGLMAPDSGRVEVCGHDVRRDPLGAKKRIGYVPDGAPLYSNLTPEEHLDLVGRLHALDGPRIARETKRLLDGLDLASRARDPVGSLSRGMRQKVAIACALLPAPSLLVLDEPLTGLDTATTLVVKALLRGWADRGGAVLVTSHLLEVVEHTSDRVAILVAGRCLACGSLQELRNQAGGGEVTLEQVFRSLTQSESPEEVAARILG